MEVIQNKVGRPGKEIIYKKVDYNKIAFAF